MRKMPEQVRQLMEYWMARKPPYFGPKWDAPATDAATHVATPTGDACYMCDHPILATEQGWIRPVSKEFRDGDNIEMRFEMLPVHRGCDLGNTIGHMYGFCSCTGYDDLYERGEALIAYLDGPRHNDLTP